MKKTFYALLLAVATLCIPTACDDSTSTIGSTLTGQNVEIKIDSSYQVSGHTVRVARIRPKTTEQLIGCIDIPAYGSLRTSNVMQFLPSTALDTANFTSENVDSLILTLRYGRGAFLGDSVAPMGISVYPLTDKFSEAAARTQQLPPPHLPRQLARPRRHVPRHHTPPRPQRRFGKTPLQSLRGAP